MTNRFNQLLGRAEELKKRLAYRSLDLIGGHAVCGMRLGRVLIVAWLLVIIAVALVLAAGMRRDVPIAGCVVEQARQQAGVLRSLSITGASSIRLQQLLDLNPSLFVNNRVMLAWISLVLVDDFAAVYRVTQ